MTFLPRLLSASLVARSISAFSTMSKSLPPRCDYLVVGGGATGMAFADTLLNSPQAHVSNSNKGPSVVMIDNHQTPGGQWHDSYDFVRLHQPSDMYGVESTKLEPVDCGSSPDAEAHRATREEILQYYETVCNSLESKHDFCFVGGTKLDAEEIENADNAKSDDNGDVLYKLDDGRSIRARKAVDARYLQPDLPIHIGPKFAFNSDKINCVPVNSLVSSELPNESKHYVIIGAGKTGMDSIVYLLEQRNIDPDDIVWVVPHEAWITARENIGSCMEFLHTCTDELQKNNDGNSMEEAIASTEFFQKGFLEWEREGKIYRFDQNILPSKFKDATLSKTELALLQKVKRVVRNGRVQSIEDDGTLKFVDGSSMALPWSASDESAAKETTFVHCSAGAFNYSKQTKKPPPIFGSRRISVQDVYGTPGFCFVGSIIGKLETLSNLSDDEKNAMCQCPTPDASQAMLPLGPSGGDIGVISKDHGLVQRLSNLRNWMATPEVRDWIVNNRLFNLNHLRAEDIDSMTNEMWHVLQESKVVA